ncbi:MAG TPA: SHOCT domain-containing protein [Solirubrobacterales bacterium]|nr:SHOCT domain-containing protein [Solirubrobacterales bacterium]
MLLAAYELGDALLTTLAIFFFVIWIWIVITILMDIFRDHEMSGWAKAVWVLFLIFIPFLTALVYLVVRGSGMRERAIKEQADAKKHFDEYVRETAAVSPVDELHKLDQLKQSGGVTEEEYNKMKAKIIG